MRFNLLILFIAALVIIFIGSGSLKAQENYVNSIGMEFVRIPAGSFLMGSDPNVDRDAIPDETPQHIVTITKDFYIGKFEVTQGQWMAVMGNNPSSQVAEDHPVESVTYKNIQSFLNLLNSKDPGHNYRLPTEAEWAYATKAGTTTIWHFGDDPSSLTIYAWYIANSDDKHHKVGQKKPNPWGLHDVYGNVWEWTADRYDKTYYSNSPQNDPQGPEGEPYFERSVRGGGYDKDPSFLRSENRAGEEETFHNERLGFRVAFTSEKQKMRLRKAP
ncbi:MAG: formylglycine-generating enzyme family protein [Deltaproteobacteria bacterium]|jgi:formylglycine-generating enzyme required for sulfatase activity|nr:formylglycine-generating enzyme family protein [Deltaproteobacteria bacterium]